MGRKGSGGVQVRERSIRIGYTIPGQARQRRTLMLNGRPLAPTTANIRYAHRLAEEIRLRIAHGTFSEAEYFPASGAGSAITVSGQLATWLSAQRIEISTRAGYESAIRFWTSSIGSQPLRALRPSHILTAIAARPGLSGKTVNNYVSVLRESMALAVADRLLDDNPAASIPRARHQKEPPDPFEASERDAIVAEAKRSIPASVANLVQFWFWTGMRTSEIAGLQWSSVDLASGRVVISEALVRGSAKRTTKTATARTVILNSFALEAVRAQREHTYLAGGPVWTDPRSGGPWHEERAFRRSYWTPILKRLGLRYRRPYQMRHTYATEMLMSGLKPAFCAKQLGHSVEVLLRVYAKWVDGERDDEEMAKLEAGARRDSVQDWPQDSSDGS